MLNQCSNNRLAIEIIKVLNLRGLKMKKVVQFIEGFIFFD